uniref:Uncharacterized protein n=1 Tax=Rhizophora mucronata TaxID=61149 RepID=A0A2P2K4D0_RHIMU
MEFTLFFIIIYFELYVV